MTERRSGRTARGAVDLFGTETEEPLKDISTKKIHSSRKNQGETALGTAHTYAVSSAALTTEPRAVSSVVARREMVLCNEPQTKNQAVAIGTEGAPWFG